MNNAQTNHSTHGPGYGQSWDCTTKLAASHPRSKLTDEICHLKQNAYYSSAIEKLVNNMPVRVAIDWALNFIHSEVNNDLQSTQLNKLISIQHWLNGNENTDLITTQVEALAPEDCLALAVTWNQQNPEDISLAGSAIYSAIMLQIQLNSTKDKEQQFCRVIDDGLSLL